MLRADAGHRHRLFALLLRSVAGAAGAVASILALVIAGAVPHLSPWLPNRLSGSLASLIGRRPPDDIWKAVLVALLGTLVLSALAIRPAAPLESRAARGPQAFPGASGISAEARLSLGSPSRGPLRRRGHSLSRSTVLVSAANKVTCAPRCSQARRPITTAKVP